MLIPFGVFSAAGAGGGAAGAYELISTTTLASETTTISFTSIASTYKHLQLRYTARTAQTGQASLLLTFNSDTGTNYARHGLDGDGSSVSSFASTSQRNIGFATFPGSGETSGIFGAGIVDILDYASTSKNKTLRTLNTGTSSGAMSIRFRSGLWMSTSAVSTITLTNASDANFAIGSRFSLYGIKG